ncbi:MAG: thioredoxin family protein [Bacteroidales bacterium]|nr:thioredoxin family protein [Bacteroidales bacterium]
MASNILSALLSLIILQASPAVSWKAAVKHIEGNTYELAVTGRIAPDYYVHTMSDPYVGTTLEVETSDKVSAAGEVEEFFTAGEYKGETVAVGKYVLTQKLEINGSSSVKGKVGWSACTGEMCGMPEEYEFVAAVGSAAPGNDKGGRSIWGLIAEAVLWGLLMLLTPCVFPMVPMTVSFFLKQSGNPARGRFNALMYGLFIVLLYTIPICIIIGLTWAVGGAAVTADIFNWLATHWLPNIVFFLVFMVFAASFFGAFEIVLPSKWTTGADEKSSRGGLLGVFFLALTLVLVSFSCTGPIVGTVLIKSTQGEFWTPMVTMLSFSIAFALPFALLAFFPSLLKKLPKSGGWLNSVKVVLGFVEIALGLKFLSTADQTYHWHLLDREVYLAIWIVCFTLLGLYLMGKLRFKHDSPLEYISACRLALIIADFAFVVYLIPGMWGAPLKAMSGYLPPLETQDFIFGKYAPASREEKTFEFAGSEVSLPHGLTGYNDLQDGIDAAAAEGKKVFVDITGHGCVNCREMEARVWSDPRILKKLRNDYVIVSLYVDDKTKLPESRWVTTPEGKVLKDIGRVNSRLVLERFGVNSQPNYFLLDGNGKILRGPRGYNLDRDAFLEFLSL